MKSEILILNPTKELKMKTEIKMIWKKDTKRTAVYINDETGAAVSQVYVQKTALGSPIPKEIKLTVEYS